MDTNPYAVSLNLTVGINAELILNGGVFEGSFGSNLKILVSRLPSRPRDDALFQVPFNFRLEPFASATEAEKSGLKLVAAVLWVAVSRKMTIGLQEGMGEFPFRVVVRGQSRGAEMSAEGRVFHRIGVDDFLSEAKSVFEVEQDTPNFPLAKSLEFFASARLERSANSRFIFLVTALEAICEQYDLGESIGIALKAAATAFRNAPGLDELDPVVKTSIADRIANLRRESVRQALRRIVTEVSSEPAQFALLDRVYELRSNLLHTGVTFPEIEDYSRKVEEFLRQVYSKRLRVKLWRE